jgi:superfamily II DNA helicase RecQ
VSPLKSLIRDQLTELRKHNIMAYGILVRMEKEEIDGMFFSVFICFRLFCLVFFGAGAFWFCLLV